MHSRKLESDRLRSARRDWALLIILFAFNLWSGGTTIIGAQQVLPKNLALLCGIAVQVMLFCLLSGFAMGNSFFRRSIAILFFSFISVYTSFFCYYDILASEVDQRDEYAKALESHAVLVAEVFTPIQEKKQNLKTEFDQLNFLVKQECEFGITTNQVGCGPKANEFRIQATQKAAELQTLETTIQEIDPKFNYDSQGLEPEEIYKKDLEALSSTPKNLRGEYQIKLDMYISRELDISLLTPYYKILKLDSREDSALLAFIIAVGIDGMAILQGTAIEISHQRKNPIQLITYMAQAILRDLKALRATFDKEIKAPGIPAGTIGVSKKSTLGLRKVVDFINEKSMGKGDEFLATFYKSINNEIPHTVNKRLLSSQKDEILQYGYSLIIKKMCEPDIGWIRTKIAADRKRYILVIPGEHYNDVINWIERERLRIRPSLSEEDRTTLRHIELNNNTSISRHQQVSREEASWRDIFNGMDIDKNEN